LAPVIILAAMIGALAGLGLARFPVPSYVQRAVNPAATARKETQSPPNPAAVSTRRVRDARSNAMPATTPGSNARQSDRAPAQPPTGRDSAPPETVSPPSSPLPSEVAPPASGGSTTSLPKPAPPKEPPAVPRAKKPHRRPAALPGEVAYVRESGRMIALTFDAGASGEPTKSILSTLRSQGIRVTFFLTGKWAEKYPALVKSISDDGHEIANHTYSHPDLRKLGADSITEQLDRTDQIIFKLTGQHTAPLFSPPFGSRDARVLSTAAKAGYSGIYWSLDSWDSVKQGITSREIADRVLERAQAGDIVLLHCGSAATAEALPEIVRELRAQGLQIVTVSELIGR